MRLKLTTFVLIMLLAAGSATPLYAARLKDIADVEGVRGNQLYGYGIIVGLNGTGDGNSVKFTNQSISNMLDQVGVRIAPELVKVKNVASVMVTATLPPFGRPGSKIDVVLSSLGDAKSLSGGTLMLTSLKGPDGNVYAVAQGPVSTGSFAVQTSDGDSAQKNHPTVGYITGGAYIERSIPFDLFQSKRVRIVLRQPDFTTMTRVVDSINQYVGRPLAVAVDASSVELPLVGNFLRDPIGMVAKLEQIEVHPDVSAKVVVNERTGTIIMGESVRVSKVALAHGNLNVAIQTEEQVSQPNAFSERGRTETVENSDITVGEEMGSLKVVGGHVTLGELVSALNALGATPRDLVSIFTALKRSGALQADLVIM